MEKSPAAKREKPVTRGFGRDQVRRPTRCAARIDAAAATARRLPGSSNASAPSSWTVARRRSAALASIGLVASRRPERLDAFVAGDPQDAQHVGPVRHEDRGRGGRGRAASAATVRSDSSVVRPWSSTRIASAGTPFDDRVVAAGRGLGRLVAVGLAAGHDERRREALLEQVDRVVEAGPVDRRGDGRCTGPRRGRRSRRPAGRRPGCPGPRSATSCRRGRGARRPPRPARAA